MESRETGKENKNTKIGHKNNGMLPEKRGEKLKV